MSLSFHTLLSFSLCVVFTLGTTFAQGGPPGGAVADILVADPERQIVFAGADSGVFRSDDGGATWRPVSEGLPGFPVTQVVGRPSLLFVSLDGGGVYRSRDGGPWEKADDGIGDAAVLSLAQNPDNENVLLAGTRSAGVFFSDNAGDGWIRPGPNGNGGGLGPGTNLALAFSPADSSRVFAASSGNNGGVLFESVDGGNNWQAQAAGFAVFRRIRFDPSNAGAVYVTTSAGLLRRPAAGAAFAQVASFGSLSVADIAVDHNDPLTLYAATDEAGLLRSSDGGATLSQAGQGLPRALVRTVRSLPETPSRVLLGLNGTGIFESRDFAATWKLSSRGLQGASVLAVAVDPSDSNVVFATIEGGGLFRSEDGGDTWTESREGLFLFRPARLVIDPSNPDRMYAGGQNPLNPNDGAISRSDDGGATWAPILSGAPIFSLAVNPSDGATLWAGTNSGTFLFPQTPLLVTRDAGVRFSGEAGDDGILFQTGDVRHVAVDPTNPRNVYVATLDRFGQSVVLWSDNDGDRFRSSAVAPPVSALTVDPTNPRRIFFGTTPIDTAGQTLNGQVFRSEDAGRNFGGSSAGLPSNELRTINSIVVEPNGGVIYASTGLSVYRSEDSGANWQRASEGLPLVGIRRLAVDPGRPGVVYAATLGRGVFRSADGGESWRPAGLPPLVFTTEGVVGAADFEGGGVPPGGIMTIFGIALGPAVGVEATLDSQNKLPTELAGVRVFFNDTPAPLFFVRADQINCQAPFEIGGGGVVEVRVEYAGQSRTVAVPGAVARPGVLNAALNQDSSVNSEANPAGAGEVVQLFATGQGAVGAPGVMTGQIAPSTAPFPAPVAAVEVSIGGVAVQPGGLQFVGLAPGFVGLLQINVLLPAGLSAGPQEVVVTIGGVESPKSGTLYVAE